MASDVSSLEAVKTTDEYKQIKAKLSDREYRLDTIYWIRDKNGMPVRFQRNPAQKAYSAKEWHRDLILKSRQLGFSTFIAIEILDQCLFSSNNTADIIDRTASDAEKKLAMIRFAYERLPEFIRHAVPLTKDNQSELRFGNGSSIGAGTSSRGGTPNQLHVSEMGPISVDNPRKAKEIKVGSFPAVPKNGKIWVESTAKGTQGEFFDLVKAGERLQASGQRLTPLDFRLHFFSWNMDPANRLPVNSAIISHDLREYFDGLRVNHGIALDGEQEAWYAKTHDFYGPDDVKSEFPSIPSETFFASLEGAYFKAEMNAARREKRIGLPVPYDSSRPVDVAIDLGLDGALAVVFVQNDGLRHRFIDYARGENAGLSDFMKIIKHRSDTRGFTYNKFFAGHDMGHREWGAMPLAGNIRAPTRAEMAEEFGVKFTVIPRVQDKASSIEALRRVIATSYFCAEYAGGLVDALDSYSRRWNRSTMQWMGEPAKNGSDHPADAAQTYAMGYAPEIVRRRDQLINKRKGSHWSA